MTAPVAPSLVKSLVTDTTTVRLRPRYEGANICTWIGFKHVNYLVEEALLVHFAGCGLSARVLYEELGLGLDVVDLDTHILRALHMDDEAEAEVVPAVREHEGELAFTVTLRVVRDGVRRKAATATARVSLRVDTFFGDPGHVPAELAPYAVPRLGADLAGVPAPPPAAAAAALASGAGEQAVLDALTAGRNAYAWRWTVPYTYCHFSERLQMSGYLRLMEEAKDRFVAARGISIRSLLDDRRWIPVVPRSSLRMLGEALMEEELYTVFTVEEVFKDFTYTARMDCYAVQGRRLRRVATGSIVHGYAVIEGRRDWRLTSLDQRVLRALAGQPGGT
ncbi:hypothetical protein RKE29_21280 [Streptomyces sp. B1866]|uniref:hypothetical protein n=1 Tax=Streptomyces sp. B1866 TaxID=3075431 RepID=UPI0028924CFC|nr:hypothetical protein [Streptomyces sp. B1866]MDT3399147.1 hypothetical protein [Streptomyces sp. B1866]